MSHRPRQGTPDARQVVTATIASLLLPGLGQWLAGARLAAALILGSALLGGAAAIWHLAAGLALFESPLGSFLFRALLRGLAILHAFAVIDAYGRTAAPADRPASRRRLAVGLNLLIPGTGYLVARAWLRAATGLAILALILIFARARPLAFLDVIFVGMQVVMAGLAYLHLRLAAEREAAASGQLPPPPRPAVAPAAQIIALLVAVAAGIFAGVIVERSIPDGTLRNLSRDDLELAPGKDGSLRFGIPRLGLSVAAAGPGWTSSGSSEFLFQAEHRLGGRIMLGLQQVHPFERPERLLQRLRGWLEGKGLVHQQTKPIELDGVPATRIRFSGQLGGGDRIDHWAIVVPQRGFAFLLMLQCEQRRCDQMAPILEQSQNTFKLARR